MSYLKYEIEELKLNGGLHTAKEISSQPEMWVETYNRLFKEKDQIAKFTGDFLQNENPYVILTGAGTSAFIGEALVGAYQREWGITARAIATTDIITHPGDYFIRPRPTLLVSFARSGDSPESLATVELAKKHCDKLYILNITCNKDGELAAKTGSRDSYVFLLPEETNDRSLAMTSSYTSMLLAGLLVLNINDIDSMQPLVTKLAGYGNYIINKYLTDLNGLAKTDIERMVFLGSGPLMGAAHESHLKVQELTDGRVVCKYDSFLGFRHGPRAVVNNSTVVVYLMSNNPLVRKYELDLIKSVSETGIGFKFIAIGADIDAKGLGIDLAVNYPGSTEDIPDEFLPVIYVLPAQIIGFYKSLSLGLSPDSPSNSGSISRVVQGVKIYENTFA
ncbi:Galactosamine-6-phosphate isomerase AgaS [hydrothermal vent metagenome]|uniref:Galactosamine-6-phosphate isomerase AgaS n=1 Tax=hydrothermal vent metagenome TaxID=652676 RepID=A0A3B0UTJ1_9ZZZZ